MPLRLYRLVLPTLRGGMGAGLVDNYVELPTRWPSFPGCTRPVSGSWMSMLAGKVGSSLNYIVESLWRTFFWQTREE